MAAKPWENRLMEQRGQNDCSEVQSLKNGEDFHGSRSNYSKLGPIRIKKNNVNTRVSTKPSSMVTSSRCRAHSTSSPSSDFFYNESSASSSSLYASAAVAGYTTLVASERTEEITDRRPNYMSLTESTKAKQKSCNACRTTMVSQSGGFHFHIDSRSSDGSISVSNNAAKVKLMK